MPKISVIVPVYNVENYLNRCLDSILSQTFSDFELILIDDGSPDNCSVICDEYAAKDSRIRVIHKINGGVSVARNTGLDVAEGNYITFCDSDDYWAADMLQTLLSAAEENHADIVTSGYQHVDDEGNILNVVARYPDFCEITSEEDLLAYLIQGVMGGKYGWEACTRLYKRSIIQAHQLRFCTTCNNYAEDMGFVMQYCLYVNTARSIEYCGYYYRIRAGSMMRNSELVVKLNPMNEISAYVGNAFYQKIQTKELLKLYPVIHFLMMQNEYLKLIRSGHYQNLPNEIRKIKNQHWFVSQTRAILRCFSFLVDTYGIRNAQRILLLSHFCIHRNWNLFRYESAIAYRWFIKGD